MISSIFGSDPSNSEDQQETADGGPITIHPDTHNPNVAWEKLRVKQEVQKVKPLPVNHPISDTKVRFVCISDTHSRLLKVALPDGDVLIHTGDFSMVGKPAEIEAFNNWLGSLPHKHKIVIAGNHDLSFDEEMLQNPDSLRPFGIDAKDVEKYKLEKGIERMHEVLTNCTYLQDSETSVYGLRIYGSPWQPEFGDWGFNLPRGQPCLDKWNKIPEGIDVLMTHGPPIGHGDRCISGQRAGCVELLSTVQKRVKCKYHVFGHIHEDYGMTTDGHTTFVNACTCTLNYRAVQQPIIFDIPLPPGVTKDEALTGAAAVGEQTDQQRKEEEMETEKSEEVEAEVDRSPLVLNQEYQLENTPAPHSSTSADAFN